MASYIRKRVSLLYIYIRNHLFSGRNKKKKRGAFSYIQKIPIGKAIYRNTYFWAK